MDNEEGNYLRLKEVKNYSYATTTTVATTTRTITKPEPPHHLVLRLHLCHPHLIPRCPLRRPCTLRRHLLLLAAEEGRRRLFPVLLRGRQAGTLHLQVWKQNQHLNFLTLNILSNVLVFFKKKKGLFLTMLKSCTELMPPAFRALISPWKESKRILRRVLLRWGLWRGGDINARNAGGINSEPDFNIVKNKPIFVKKKPVR